MTVNARRAWREADAVGFDVDLTIIKNVMLDDLGAQNGVGPQVKSLREKLYENKLSTSEYTCQVLNIINPKWHDINKYMDSHQTQFIEGIRELIEILESRDTPVYLISGGLTSIILPIAAQLDIPEDRVFANKVKFYYDGKYAGYDASIFASQDKGKQLTIQYLKDKFGYKKFAYVGDETNDVITRTVADPFIGFGGAHVSEIVRSTADWFVTSYDELIKELEMPLR